MRGTRAISILTLLSLAATAGAGTVTTNTNLRYQTIDGWGTCLYPGDSNARYIYTTENWRNAYRDLGMNILRVGMEKEVLVNPGDYSIPIELGPDLQANVDLMDFHRTVEIETYGSVAQWLSQNALEPERVKISGSPWSPPHWMKGPTGNTQNFVGVTDNYPTPWLSNQHNPY